MRCLSCFKSIKSNSYCTKCRKNLFDGRNIKPLSFDKTEFYEIKSKMTNKISLSGVQDKISLKFSGDNTLVPTDRDGRFILKPIPREHDVAQKLDQIVANEHLSMQISSQIFKIPTAYNGLIEFSDGEMAYITKRFDYELNQDEKLVQKLDQEDFASVLQYSEDKAGKEYKYNSSYQEIGAKIKEEVSSYRPALEDFFIRVILNYLIGNADAHLKNFSLYRGANRTDYTLTPNYDILFTKYHLINEDGIMALDLFYDGVETKSFGIYGYYTFEDFELFGEILEIPKKRREKIYKNIINTKEKVLEIIDISFLNLEAKKSYKDAYLGRLKQGLFGGDGSLLYPS